LGTRVVYGELFEEYYACRYVRKKLGVPSEEKSTRLVAMKVEEFVYDGGELSQV
jgi:hypothetical protein